MTTGHGRTVQTFVPAPRLSCGPMPIHLRAERGDYAPAVLCPGDPRRATYIAETFFDDAGLVNEERGMLGYTGTFEGAPISVQSTGMGCPCAGIVYEELVQLGATRLVRVGTCGAIGTDMAMADTVIGVDRLRRRHDGAAVRRHGRLRAGGDVRARRDRGAPGPRERRSRARRPDRHVSPVLRPRPGQHRPLEAHRPPGIEMEAAMLYTVAAVHGVEALAMMTVSDLVTEERRRASPTRSCKRGVDAMMRLACRVAVA